MSISSTASASVQPGRAIVALNGYRLQTTMEMGAMPCAWRSAWSDGMSRARMPICESVAFCVQVRRDPCERKAHRRARQGAAS